MGIVFHRTKSNIHLGKNGDIEAEAEEYRTRMELLYEIAQEAGSVSAVSELLERILRVTRQTLDTSEAVLYMVSEEKGLLCSRSQLLLSNRGATLHQKELVLDSGITGWVARNAASGLSNDISMDVRFDANIDSVDGLVPHSVLAVPVTRGNQVIGVLAVNNESAGREFDERDTLVLKGFASTEALVLLVSMAVMAIDNINSMVLDQALLQGYRNTARAWASAVDGKDSYAYEHSRRVAEYTLMAARRLPLSPQELQDIEFGALFHDIGKIGIDSNILSKPGPLTDIEWLVVHEHSRKGANIVEGIPFLRAAKDIVLYHHERYDGTGYPERLTGTRIPIGARLVAVADAFDTITTDHSYRPAKDVDAAINELIEGIGTQFCPMAVEAFVSALKKRKTGLIKEASVKKVVKNHKEARHLIKTRKIAKADKSDVYKGDIRLVVPLTVGALEVRRFKEHLEKNEGLKILMTGSSEKEGHLIVISLEKPLELVRIISEIPSVENVEKHGRDIVVTLSGSDEIFYSC